MHIPVKISLLHVFYYHRHCHVSCYERQWKIMQSKNVGRNKENQICFVVLYSVWSFRSRQKPFVRRSSLQAHSLLLLLLSLSSGWCVKCALSFFALILKNIACKDFTCLATVSLHMHKSLAPKMVVCLSPYCMINNSSLAKDFFISHILYAKSIPF